MGELFDRYVVADWSASNSPTTGKDSIWIALLDDGADGEPGLSNPATRREAERLLVDMIDPSLRTLIAVDAPLGYPRGSAKALGMSVQPPWRAWWDELARRLTDDEANRNNRFDVAAMLNRRVHGDGPFWGRHHARPIEGLDPTKPATFPVLELRHAEASLRSRGLHPASCWQLLGAGSVGSQTLTLLPILHRPLLGGSVEVWPLTTGLTAPRVPAGTAVLAETWPTGFDIDLPAHWIRDAAQVHGVALALRESDRVGGLAEWFTPSLPAATRAVIEAEEGWVLVPS